MVKEINSLLTSISDQCEIKKKKKKNIHAYPNTAPWYDKDCFSIKNKIIHIAKLVKKFPSNLSYRENLYSLKKEYKNLTKMKKRMFQNDILDQMNS